MTHQGMLTLARTIPSATHKSKASQAAVLQVVTQGQAFPNLWHHHFPTGPPRSQWKGRVGDSSGPGLGTCILHIHPEPWPPTQHQPGREEECVPRRETKHGYESCNISSATNILHIYNWHLPCISLMFTWHFWMMPYSLMTRKSWRVATVIAILQIKKLRLGEVI